MTSNEILQGVLEATLVGSAAIVLVLALRRPFRSAFGAQAAYALWSLIPAAMLAWLLPMPVRNVLPMVSIPVLVTPQTLAGSEAISTANGVGGIVTMWLLGMAASLVWFWRRQRAFERSLGALERKGDVWVTQTACAGLPATLGVWRTRIVLPQNFDHVFDAAQRGLMLAHERRHIARRDPWANAAALLLRCGFWFNPLMHYAVVCMRHDQELACDADVLASHPQQRRSYGDALLNAQLALQVAPLGCHFGFGHPLKERLAMLGYREYSKMRRSFGTVLVALLGCSVAFAAWAAQPQTAQKNTEIRTLQPASVDVQSRMAAPPKYPAEAMKAGITGTVMLVVDVKANGAVTAVNVEKSSGHAELDQAAADAAKQWRFNPASKNGKATAGKVRVPVEFAMEMPAEPTAG